MTNHYKLIDSVPENIYQLKIFTDLRFISACKCVQIKNTAVPTQLSGVGGGYVDKRMISSYSQNGPE
jgi:hypothetical protein